MPGDSVRDIRGLGMLRRKAATSQGPADAFDSATTIDPTGLVREHTNDGTVVDRIYGDGRHFTPIQPATPGGPLVPGQFWLEQQGSDTFLFFVDHAGVIQKVVGGGGLPTPSIINLTSGVPTTIATVNVDSVGVIEWGLALYKEATGQRHHFRLVGAHDGTNVADATTTQLNQQGTISFGVLDVTLALSLSGTGAGQEMDLDATASSTNWKAAIVAERLVAP